MADSTLLEQYKALIADAGNLGTRYATANGFYLSIVSALLGVLAFTESGKPLVQVDLILVLSVAIFAIVICTIWMRMLGFYRGLLGVKLQLLGEMEKELAFPAYSRAHQLMEKRGIRPLIEDELWVPRVLWVFFALIAAAAVLLMFVDA
jgi:hypothetical protein